MVREAHREGLLTWRVWAVGIGFVLFLYGTGVPATLLWEKYPRYEPLFICVFALDGVALLAVMICGWRWQAKRRGEKLAVSDRSITIGAKDDISYTGSATESDAQALGRALQEIGYLKDRGVSVSLAKGNEGTIVSFVVKQGAWNDPANVSRFEEIGRVVAPSLGGFPIRVRLLNNQGEVQKESNVGKVSFGKDDVYYAGTAVENDAQALGQALASAGFFENRGADVFLAKHSNGVVLSFVVKQAVWDDPTTVTQFENVVRQAAPSIGGLPIKLRLVNTSLEAKKIEEIH